MPTHRRNPPIRYLSSTGKARAIVVVRIVGRVGVEQQGEIADRVIYARIDASEGIRLWISAVSGGPPVPLTNVGPQEYPGVWSPDGNWFAYRSRNEGHVRFMKVKTTGQATPVMIREMRVTRIPCWSPTGEWIAIDDESISPDGKIIRQLGNHRTLQYTFSADGKRVYGIRPQGDRNVLFSVAISGTEEQILADLGKEFRPATRMNPGIRFSLAPDGKSFVYSVIKTKPSLWLVEGFAPKAGLRLP